MKSLSLIALLLTAAVATPVLSAAPKCSNAAFTGVYGMLATGNILVAPGFPSSLLGPFGRVGRVSADGKGNISVANVASYNGTIIDESYTGTYTVSPDCSIDIKPVVGLPLGPGGALVPVPFEFIGSIAQSGDHAAVLNCGVGAPCFAGPTGNVIRVILDRENVNPVPCGSHSLNGGYELDMAGATVTGAIPGPFARDGELTFDGHSAFTGTAVVNYSGGLIQAETLSGSYSVDSSCNVTVTFSEGGSLHKWTGTLTGAGSGADVIVNDSGVVVTGTLRAQPGQSRDDEGDDNEQ